MVSYTGAVWPRLIIFGGMVVLVGVLDATVAVAGKAGYQPPDPTLGLIFIVVGAVILAIAAAPYVAGHTRGRDGAH